MTFIYTWALRIVAAAAIGFALWGAGFVKGDDHGQGVVRAADAVQQKKVWAAFEANTADATRLGGLLTQANAIGLKYFGQLKDATANDRQPTVPSPGAATAVPVLTARAVCLWNRAWAGADVPGGQAGSVDDGAAGCAGADAKTASGFDIRDALYSDGNAAEVCWDDIRELRSLQQWERDRAARAAPKP